MRCELATEVAMICGRNVDVALVYLYPYHDLRATSVRVHHHHHRGIVTFDGSGSDGAIR